MAVNIQKYQELYSTLEAQQVSLVAVSKLKSVEDIMQLYELGHRDFGENYVQELLAKYEQLPKDIRWHFIGHLQSNKVKYISPFIYLIHGVDKLSLLKEINKQAAKLNRTINCLLQMHIARESSKFGFEESEIKEIQVVDYPNVRFLGMMGMASFTDDRTVIEAEFDKLVNLYDELQIKFPDFYIRSMGMSDDYPIAISKGSNMVRIGSLLFGRRS